MCLGSYGRIVSATRQAVRASLSSESPASQGLSPVLGLPVAGGLLVSVSASWMVAHPPLSRGLSRPLEARPFCVWRRQLL